jgi:hypothetical protein
MNLGPLELLIILVLVGLLVGLIVTALRRDKGTPCPRCGNRLAAGATTCTTCGFDLIAGHEGSLPPPRR